MDVVLQTHDEACSLELRDVELLSDGHDYRAILVVRSHGFCLEREFFFEPFSLRAFVKSLTRLDVTLSGVAKLGPLHEPDNISVEVTRTGQVVVSGEIHDSAEIPQHLRFGFRTDQTCLRPLIADLHELLETSA